MITPGWLYPPSPPREREQNEPGVIITGLTPEGGIAQVWGFPVWHDVRDQSFQNTAWKVGDQFTTVYPPESDVIPGYPGTAAQWEVIGVTRTGLTSYRVDARMIQQWVFNRG